MKHSTNGFSPFALMFGREPCLPIDVALGVNPVSSGSKSYPAYITNLRDHLSHAYRKVLEESKKSAARNKQLYNSRACQAAIQEGDLVLMRNLSIRGKQKLADRWEENPYQVVECISGLPVYKVQDKDGKERVLHPNLLLPFRGPPSAPGAGPRPVRPKRPRQFKNPPDNSRGDLETIIEEDTDDRLYPELAPISAPQPLDPEVPTFLPTCVYTPDIVLGWRIPHRLAHSRDTQTLLQLERNTKLMLCTPVIPQPDLPKIADSDERPTEVTHFESGPELAAAEPEQDPPYMTRAGRASKPPPRLICNPMWSQKASVLPSLANSHNQELLQNVLQTWLNS